MTGVDSHSMPVIIFKGYKMWYTDIEKKLIELKTDKDSTEYKKCIDSIHDMYKKIDYMISRFMYEYGERIGIDKDVDSMYVYLSDEYFQVERLLRIKGAY